MARGFISDVIRIAQAAERANKAQTREQLRLARELEKASRLRERADQKSYFQNRNDEADELNRLLSERCGELETILPDGVGRSVSFDWFALRRTADVKELRKHPHLNSGPRPSLADYAPAEPPLLNRLVPGWKQRHQRLVDEAQTAFKQAENKFVSIQKARKEFMDRLEAEAEEHNELVESLRKAYLAGDPDAVSGFFDLVFELSIYPEGFPNKWKTFYEIDSKHLIAEFDLPNMDDIVPKVERYRYVKASDQITETKKSEKARRLLYTLAVSQSVLRRLHEIYKSDNENVVGVVTINAYVDAIDPSSGKRVRPCLVSVRTTRNEFQDLDLRHVDPAACLKRLSAAVSRSPSELVAVKPIIELNMADPRFIQEEDILSSLDTRPNLMDLTPGEFESLITNLFQKMGLETKQTQASRDGGVDCVAFDPRPVLGGKVVIQAKRYRNTVGVSAVRDLFGTMHNEGATKGILVTTSGYGAAAYEFANGKPLELMSGSNLLYLLKEQAGIDAKIVMPEDWQDR
jgi:restriction system protein